MITILTTFIVICEANSEKSNQIDQEISFSFSETIHDDPKPYVKLLDVST